MSYQQRFACDVCGVEKKETNHWLIAFAIREINNESRAIELIGIKILAWDLGLAQGLVRHLCGESCAAIYLSEFLGKLKEGTV